jgi:hypothetical protein
MTEASGDMGQHAGRRWDVALSFAGAQRDYVEQVAQALKARGVRCFYDADEQTELWGTYLAEELPRIYARESAAVVVFLSADYAGRDWARLERRAAFSRAVAEAGVYVLPARFDDSELPGLLPDVVTIDLRRYTPAQFAGLIAEKLADLAASPSPPGGTVRSPAGAVRVEEADPRRLGVHAAISVSGMPDEIPPEYVPRDVDAAESGVRAKVAAAAGRGGFVLLVGGSSVGKTRCAAEAVKALLPDWWLVRPAGPDQLAALAAAPFPRAVVWLDELQDYLDGEHGLTSAVMRALLNHRAVIIGTLWPDRYAAYTTVREPGGADPRAGTPGTGPGRRRPHRLGVQPCRAGPGPRRRGPGSAAGGRAGGGRVRADPDPGGRAAAGRPVGRRPDRQAVRVGGAHRGAGRGPARRPRPAECRVPARGRGGILHQPAAGRGAR